jgi:uncharacterized protein
MSNNVPQVYNDCYTNWYNNHLLIYQPLSEKGLVVLNKESAFVYSLIDNKKTVKEILYEIQKKDKNADIKDLNKILKNFEEQEIICFNKPKQKTYFYKLKPTHLGVWLHITNQCNLRCTYCYVAKSQEKMSDETVKKTVNKIFQSAVKHKIKKITFKFAGGEPLLELNKIINITKQAKLLADKYKIKIEFVIISNGVLLIDNICQIIKKNNIRLAISLDGLGEYHDQTRIFKNGTGSFQYVEKGIINILKYKIPFNVSITVTNKNIENIPLLTDYLLKKHIPFVFNFYRENPNVKEELCGDDKKLIDGLKKAYKIICDNPPRYSLINGLLDRVSFESSHVLTCGMGFNYLVIRYDGKLISCQMTQDRVIGSIDDSDLIETMQKGNFIKPRGLTVEGKKPCNKCQWKYVCCGGCPLLTSEQKGKFDTSSPYCNVYKALIPEVLKVEAVRLIKYSD